MYRKFLPLILIAESPIHAGSGSELGIVDLPIQREKYTNFPKIEGSGLKGCIREAFRFSKKEANVESSLENMSNDDLISLVFGPEEGDAHAGSIAFTDAKILLFPVKSLKGVFGWITCPMVLNRFVEDMKFADKVDSIKEWNLEKIRYTVPEDSDLVIFGDRIVLEEFTFKIEKSNKTSKVASILSNIVFNEDTAYEYWKDKLRKNLVVLSDDDFQQFVTHSTEVITRTKIDSETGTVQSGALWTEEYLPQDSILYSIVMTTPVRVKEEKKGPFKGENPDEEAEKVMNFFKLKVPEVIHLGGNQTIGKGIVRIKLLED